MAGPSLAQKIGAPVFQDLFIHTVKVPKELEIFLPAQKLEERNLLRAYPDAFLDFGHIFADVQAADLDGAR